MTRVAAALTVLGLVVGAAGLNAQTEAEAVLSGARMLTCTFPMSVRTTWKGADPAPVIRRTGNLTLEFREMKPDQGSAGITAGRNVRDLTLVADERTRHFIDAGGGRVAVTTVLGEFSTGQRLQATHHIVDYTALEIASFRSEPEVVQHIGDCEATP